MIEKAGEVSTKKFRAELEGLVDVKGDGDGVEGARAQDQTEPRWEIWRHRSSKLAVSDQRQLPATAVVKP